MANTPQQDDRFYKGNSLIKAFAISSIVMLVVSIWMVLDDYGREWKGYQKEFNELKVKKTEKQIEEAKAAVDENKIKELKVALLKSEEDLKAKQKELDQLDTEYVKLTTRESIAVEKYQDEKANWDVEKYHYEADFGHHAAEGEPQHENKKATAAYEKLQKNLGKVIAAQNNSNEATKAKEDKKKEIDAQFAEKNKIQKEITTAQSESNRLDSVKEGAELTINKLIRNSPVMDLASPTFKLQQIVLPTIRDDIYFAQVQKVDRCTTCHLAIDTPGYETEANPYKTHPKLDLILGSRSPHPIDKVGCTVCHEGRGQASHFSRTAHTPRNEEQEKEWVKKYGWTEMHHVSEKMIPLQFTEGKCRVCHKSTEFVPKAQKLTASNQLIKAAGCYGCHRIEGWDHLRKLAPSLKKVKGKLSRDWIVKWVKNPRSFNEHARMPASFFQGNIESEEYKSYNEAEVHAVVDYVLNLSDGYTPNLRLNLGNVDAGKKLFGEVGCLGCHQVSDFPYGRGRFGMAPDLSTVGSKVSKDWLTSWLKNPRHYFEDTTMPSLRLSDQEISDLSAYLMQKKNPEFENADVGKADVEVQKKVLRLYLLRDPKMAPATEEKIKNYIEALKPHEISLKLGENAMARYGCYGCHEIKGWEKIQGIGVELTEEGSKPINKFDFGLLHFKHANYAWFDKKLENTRVFDKGTVKEYLDLLRMPQYGFDKGERDSITTTLLGLTSQKVTPPAAKEMTSRDSMMEDGLRVVHKYNCQGCHMVEGIYQALPDDHPNHDEFEKEWKNKTENRIMSHYSEDETVGPPPLVTQGKRVRTDWAYSFIQDPSNKLRYKLKIRMPSFQMPSDELNRLVSYWAAYGNVEFPISHLKPVEFSGNQLATAKALFDKLQCMSCHTVGTTPTVADMEGGSKGLAPDLTRASGRLRKDWIVELLKNPQNMIPGTRMPGFWPDGVSPAPEILKGDSKAQIELLADYILWLGQGSKTPAKKTTENASPKKEIKLSKARR